MARYRIVWLGALVLACLLILPVQADMISPAVTNVYFEKDGVPFNGSVQYTVDCYGYGMTPGNYQKRAAGTYQPSPVFHYTATCPEYGCTIYLPYYFMYTHIDWCDVSGVAGNQPFSIRNFSVMPWTRSYYIPERVAKRWSTGTEYFYETPEYDACRDFGYRFANVSVLRISYATVPSANTSYPGRIVFFSGRNPIYEAPEWSRLSINRTGISWDLPKYIHYLETCDPVTNRRCPGWFVNGTPMKTFTEYRTLMKNETDLAEHPCDTFLLKADSDEMIMPFVDNPWPHACVDNCNLTRQVVELRVAIPPAEVAG